MTDYKCCATESLETEDYLYGICCYPCTYGYGCYKALSPADKNFGFCAGALVAVASCCGSTVAAPFAGCYVRVTQLGQTFGYSILMECCAPCTCAPCQMSRYGRGKNVSGAGEANLL